MKKTLLLLLLFYISLPSFAFKSWRIGVTGAYNNTRLLNKNVRSDPNIVIGNSFGKSMGLSIKYNYRSWDYNTRHYGYTVEVLLSDYVQKYEPGFAANWNSKQTNIFYIDVPILFRYTTDYIINCEIGPQVSILRSAYGDFVFDPTFASVNNENSDISAYFLPYNFSMLARASVDIRLSGLLAITPGVRFAYGFMDILSKEGKDFAEPYHQKNEIFYKGTRTMTAGFFLIFSFRI